MLINSDKLTASIKRVGGRYLPFSPVEPVDFGLADSIHLSKGCHFVANIMTSEGAPQGDDVMASVDEEGYGETRLVIADITRDEAWVSMSQDTTKPLASMR